MFATINGIFPKAYIPQGRVNLSQLQRSASGDRSRFPDVEIEDARPLQARAASDAAFFDGHGFVLLDAPTAVTDWDCDQSAPDNPIARHYFGEVEAIVRDRLYPGRRIELFQPPRVVRRGPGTDNPNYAQGVHQDFGRTPDDYQHNLVAYAGAAVGEQWRRRFEMPDIERFITLDFWRTAGMADPLRHMPLAICDPASVDREDVIETLLEGITPSGMPSRLLALRHDAAQRWYYYPAMTPDEVLVFKLCELRRDTADPTLASCFHTAVVDPDTPDDAPARQSCEHRVSVFLLKN